MKRPATPVSDHAVLRYLERVMGFDVETLRCEIGRFCDDAAKLGATAVTVSGWTFRIRDGVVVTVVPRSSEALTRSRDRNGEDDG